MQGHDDGVIPKDNTPNSNDSAPASPQSGAIFSTQDLTINPENITPSNTQRISSAFGHRSSTFGRSSAPETPSSSPIASSGANPFSPQNSQFNSTATGDIRLPSSGAKHRKWPVFILIILVLAAAGFGIFALLRWVGGDGATSASETSLEEAQRAFARYANYLLYGEERDTLDGEFEVGKTYELDRQLADKNPDSEYWNKASGLLNTAVTSYDRFPEKKESVVEELNLEKEYFDVLNADRQIHITDDEIAIGIVAHGEDWVRDNMRSKYDTWSEFSTEIGKELVQNIISRYSAQIALVTQFIDGGCFIHNSLDTDCTFELQQTKNNGALSDAIDSNKQAQEVLGSIRRRLRNGFLNQTWLINLQMSEKQESQGGGAE